MKRVTSILFVDPSLRRQAACSPFLTTPSKKVRLLTPLRFVLSLQANSVSVFTLVRSPIPISRHSTQDDRFKKEGGDRYFRDGKPIPYCFVTTKTCLVFPARVILEQASTFEILRFARE